MRLHVAFVASDAAAALGPFRSAEMFYLGRRNQMVAAFWLDNSNNG